MNALQAWLMRQTPRSSDVNAQDNTVYRWSRYDFDDVDEMNRYFFDSGLCAHSRGWQQYDTQQDASYFGYWVHPTDLLTFTYCEGDLHLVVCPTVGSLRSELARSAEFYGDPPPCALMFGNDGVLTKVYDPRPVV